MWDATAVGLRLRRERNGAAGLGLGREAEATLRRWLLFLSKLGLELLVLGERVMVSDT